MLNEEKIRLMTDIAIFEKKAAKDTFPINSFFMSDYIGSHLIRSFLAYTLTWLIGAAMWLLYNIEEILDTMDITGLLESGKSFLIYYLAGLLIYLLITWIVYFRRYRRASKSMKVYQAKLKRLERKYAEGGK